MPVPELAFFAAQVTIGLTKAQPLFRDGSQYFFVSNLLLWNKKLIFVVFNLIILLFDLLCLIIGCEKLGYGSLRGCCVVEESDGTLLDEDEILMEKSKEVLMILKPGEAWKSVSEINCGSTAVREPTVNSFTDESLVGESISTSITVATAISDSAEGSASKQHYSMPNEGC